MLCDDKRELVCTIMRSGGVQDAGTKRSADVGLSAPCGGIKGAAEVCGTVVFSW